MDVEIRPIGADELDDPRRTLGFSMGFDPHPEDHRLRHVLPLDRTRCGFQEGRMVGTCAAFSLEMTVPGGQVPCGGTTLVSVAPTHRRRGLLRRMLQAHLEDVAEREEPIAALWSSDSAIYGRFGYGTASVNYQVEVDAAHTELHRLAPEPIEVRLIDRGEATELVTAFYRRQVSSIPGFLERDAQWWQHRRFADPEWNRSGMTAKRLAVARGDQGIEGFVQYRAESRWEQGHGAGTLSVVELLGGTPRAWVALWSYVLDHDLTSKVTADLRPPWDPLFDLLAGSRRARARRNHALWVRIMDVPRALEARRYSGPIDLVFAVSDPTGLVSGRYRLTVAEDQPACGVTDDDPDIELDLEDLGACYLGRSGFRRLARPGRLRGRPEALTTADRAFGWDPEPWCPEVF